jgi:hypothetical protein
VPRILAKGRDIGSKHRVDLKLSIGRALLLLEDFLGEESLAV